MTTHMTRASNTDGSERVPAQVRAEDPTRLAQTELDAVAGGGGPVGVNPSRK